MTATNVPEVTSAPYPDDLQAITDEWLNQCGPHDYGINAGMCGCPDGDPRPVIAQLVNEVQRLRLTLAAAEARGVERGRTEAAEAIAAHRDKFWPKDDRLDSARARVRRHLNIAIQVAGPPITLEDAAKALRAHLEAPTTKGRPPILDTAKLNDVFAAAQARGHGKWASRPRAVDEAGPADVGSVSSATLGLIAAATANSGATEIAAEFDQDADDYRDVLDAHPEDA